MATERLGGSPPDIGGKSTESEQSIRPTAPLHEDLKKLGIETSSEALEKLSKDPETLQSVITDLQTLQNAHPPLANEITHIGNTIDDATHSITVDGKEYSHAKLKIIAQQNLDQAINFIENSDLNASQKEVLYNSIYQDDAQDQNRASVRETKKNTTIQDTLQNGTEIQEKNLQKERLSKINDTLRQGVEEIQSLDLDTPSIESLRNNSRNIPELRGVSSEDLRSGQYDNIIYADYYEQSEKSILSQTNDPNKQEQIRRIITNFRDTLGRPGKYEFQSILHDRALGKDRDTIESLGNTLIKKGYKKEVEWDPKTRTITFENARGEKRIIETAKQPPEERVVAGAIEISQPLQAPRKNPYTETKNRVTSNIQQSIEHAKTAPFIGALQGTPEQREIETTWKRIPSENPLESVSLAQNTLDLKLEATEKLMREAEASGEISEAKKLQQDIHIMQEQKKTLDTLLTEYASTLKQEQAEQEKIGTDRFGETASQNRDGLKALGIDRAFADMNEVSQFFMASNDTLFGDKLINRSSINNYLATEKLGERQYRHLLDSLTKLYIHEQGDQALQGQTEREKIDILRFTEPNGKSRIENTLTSLRLKNGGVPIRAEAFSQILQDHKSEISQ